MSTLVRSDFGKWLLQSRETGKVVIGQPPNLAQKIFSGTTLAGVALPRSSARTGAGVLAVVALTWWAVDELARGVNPFRRILGTFTLGAIAWLALRRSH